MIRILGDIHGTFGEITQACIKYPYDTIVSVGDVGLGFPAMEKHHGVWLRVEGNNDPESFPNNFYFIGGNHDDPRACSKYPNYLGRYGYNKELDIFYVSGGHSIDALQRTEGIDWWRDEELSYDDFSKCIELYEHIKPEIVISHECPASIQEIILKGKNLYGFSRTAKALQLMLDIHQPKQWYFGHYHKTFSKKVGKTQFTCAAINQLVPVK